MKTNLSKSILIAAWLLTSASLAQAQELAKVPSNFDTAVWARPTENPPEINAFPWGEISVPCSFSHMRHDDPIAKPNQFGAAPLHVFFGNRLTDASSTYTSLRSGGEGTCFGGPLNRSTYFIPAMLNGLGKTVLPDFMDVYYRGDASTRPFPRGLKMFFGYDAANPTAYTWEENDPRFAWSFGSGQGFWWGTPNYSGKTRFPTLTPGLMPSWIWNGAYHQMTVRAVSPQCWNGTTLDSADHRSHLAYPTKDVLGNTYCPTTHPVKIPEVTVTVSYRNKDLAEVSTWFLASDRFGGRNLPAGTNFYVGFIPAWDDDIMAAFTTNVLNTNKFGAFGKIDGTRILEKPPTSKTFAPTAAAPGYFLWTLHSFNFPYGLVEGDNHLADIPTTK